MLIIHREFLLNTAKTNFLSQTWNAWDKKLVLAILTLRPLSTTIVPYANSLDPHEMPSNSASHPDPSYLTFRQHNFHHLWATVKHFENWSRQEIWQTSIYSAGQGLNNNSLWINKMKTVYFMAKKLLVLTFQFRVVAKKVYVHIDSICTYNFIV